MAYDGKIEFDDLFKELKEAKDMNVKFLYNLEKYKDNIFFDDYLNIDNNEIKIYGREFSETNGEIDCNNEEYFFVGAKPHYDTKHKNIIYLFGACYSILRDKQAFCVELDYKDLKALLDYYSWVLKDNTKENYKKWFLDEIERNKENPVALAILYQELPDFVFTALPLDSIGFKQILVQFVNSENTKGVFNILKAWLQKDSKSLYEFFNSDSICFGIYSFFYEEYGPRKELAEYVHILTQAYYQYKQQFRISENQILEFPKKSGSANFRSVPFIPRNNKNEKFEPKFHISKYKLVSPKGLDRYTRVTEDEEITQQFLISPLGTIRLTFKIPKNEIQEILENSILYVPIEGQNVVFSAEIPAIFFHFLYEGEYVDYLNKGRLELLISAATSIGNLGIAKAIVNPVNIWFYRLAISEAIFMSLNNAINNPTIIAQLQKTAAGNHFLTIWNSYIFPVGGAVYLVAGIYEIFISLLRSRHIIEAIATDAKSKKAIDELLSGGAKSIEEALELSDDVVTVLKKLKLNIKPNTKTIDLLEKNGELFFRLEKQELPMLISFLKLTKAQRRLAIKQATTDMLINSKAKYNPNTAVKKGFKLLTSKNKLCPDFETSSYLYNSKSIVKIRLTGDREKDFVKAFKEMGIDDLDEIDLIRKKYVWHHLDNLNEDLECTMQLVEKRVHDKLKHIGSCGQVVRLKVINKYR